MQESVQQLVIEVQSAELSLEESHAVLDRLDQLAQAGFGETEIARLSDLLAQISAERGRAG